MSHPLQRNNFLVALSAPSGGGKTTICRRLLSLDSELGYSVSTTTRQRRPGEEEGIAYNFVDRDTFINLRDNGFFLEWAEVHGELYGTRRDLVDQRLQSGVDALLDIDVQGAMQLRRVRPDAVLIFILPPSMKTLETRLRERKSDGEDTIARRLRTAREEIAKAGEFDYLVVNDDLDAAVEQTHDIIVAERLRVGRYQAFDIECLE